tara:strand:+ start:3065 stop:4114 length:1050 start_codon:yes stop_codon:yes gene_type:complete
MDWIINLMEKGWVPDQLIRMGIYHLVRHRMRELLKVFSHNEKKEKENFITKMKASPIAMHTQEANVQHYEVPAEFFDLILGDHKKYSGCFWENGSKSLTDAEEASLRISCERAQIENGMDILELGCGWGSLSLWLAEHFPESKVISVSNSRLQRQYIMKHCGRKNLSNLEVVTCDMNSFQIDVQFDRVVSIEMFEHMRNYDLLLKSIHSWLKPCGKLFIHIFCNKRYPYFFETEGDHNWLGRYFFTGGLMPSEDLPGYFQDALTLESQWHWNGEHYQKTAEMWLMNMDAQRKKIMPIFMKVYGTQNASLWFQRWRIFFMACGELFGYKNGQQWGVAHYRFEKNDGKVKE